MIVLGGLCMLSQSNPTRQGLFIREPFEKWKPGTGESLSLSNRSNERQLNHFSRTMNHYFRIKPFVPVTLDHHTPQLQWFYFWLVVNMIDHAVVTIVHPISVQSRIVHRSSLQGLFLDLHYQSSCLSSLLLIHFITYRPGRVLIPFLSAVESKVADHSQDRSRQHVHIRATHRGPAW